MDTKKLRQKILDLAIRGKLVPQDPNDEPASVLLERIRAEKQQLIKEGKIKAPKASKATDTSHYGNDNPPFDIPEGWVWCKVGDIYAHNTGKALNKADNSGQLLEYITTSNLYWDTFVLDDLRMMYFNDDEIEKCTARKGDLLVCEGGDIGRAAIWPYDNDIRIQNHIHRLRGILPVNNRFYLYVLQHYKWNGLIGGKGIGLLGFSSGELDKLQIPLPPLNEQNRIVDTIERLFFVVKTIDEGSNLLNDYIADTKARILTLAISGKLVPQDPTDEPAIDLLKRINPDFVPCDISHYPVELPSGWTAMPLGQICDTINGLWKGKKEPFVSIGVIRNANFTKDFKLDYSNIEYLDVEASSFAKRALKNGDLIVEKSGGSEKNPVGRAILYEGESGKYSFSNFTMALRIKDCRIMNSHFLYYAIMAYYLRGDMSKMQTQTTGLHNLIGDKYLSMLIPLPPIEEQMRIVKKIELLFTSLNEIKATLC